MKRRDADGPQQGRSSRPKTTLSAQRGAGVPGAGLPGPVRTAGLRKRPLVAPRARARGPLGTHGRTARAGRCLHLETRDTVVGKGASSAGSGCAPGGKGVAHPRGGGRSPSSHDHSGRTSHLPLRTHCPPRAAPPAPSPCEVGTRTPLSRCTGAAWPEQPTCV